MDAFTRALSLSPTRRRPSSLLRESRRPPRRCHPLPPISQPLSLTSLPLYLLPVSLHRRQVVANPFDLLKVFTIFLRFSYTIHDRIECTIGRGIPRRIHLVHLARGGHFT
jgi:hypothetical protein